MTKSTVDAAVIAAALPTVLAKRSREAFEALLSPDVRWGGHDDNEHTCHTREQAGTTYAELLSNGTHLSIVSTQVRDDQIFTRLQVTENDSPDPAFQSRVVLTVHDGMVVSILQVDDDEPVT